MGGRTRGKAAALTAAAALQTLTVAAPAAAAPSCFGRTATIVGTRGADRISGTEHPDVIAALGGDDVVLGGDGRDLVCGGDGDDRLDGRYGSDFLSGGDGDDRTSGGPGDDLLLGGAGRDVLEGEAGAADTLVGGPGGDSLLGGDGRNDEDYLFGGEAEDLVDGGLGGRDRLYPGPGNDYVLDGIVSFEFSDAPVSADVSGNDPDAGASGEGRDHLVSVDGIVGSQHDDFITGGDARMVLRGGPGDDRVRGGAAEDDVDGGPGSDDLDGGAGRDILRFEDSPAGVTASLRDGASAGAGDDVLAGFEDLEGSFFDDHLTGTDERNSIYGSYGTNVAFALGGNDYLEFVDEGDAGDGNDECIWVSFDVADCEANGHYDPPALPFVSHPEQAATVSRLGTVRGGIAGGLGGPDTDRVKVSVRRMTVDGCSWWDAEAGGFVRGLCGRSRGNAVAIEDGSWELRVDADLEPGAYQVSVAWRGDFSEFVCAGAFEPMCVSVHVR